MTYIKFLNAKETISEKPPSSPTYEGGNSPEKGYYFYLKGFVEAASEDNQKMVEVFYTTDKKNWKVERCYFVCILPNGRELWTFNFLALFRSGSQGYVSLENQYEFAVKLSSFSNEYWDNNYWKNYTFTDHVESLQYPGEEKKVAIKQFIPPVIGVSLGFSRAKPFIRYTTDEWNSYNDLPLTIKQDGLHTREKGNAVIPKGLLEFAVCFEQTDGSRKWNNNAGRNFRTYVE